MTQNAIQKNKTELTIEYAQVELSLSDLNDLCDATDAAIDDGGGFGWIQLPARETLERFWNGAIVMPQRDVFLARMDDTICGACVLVHPPQNNEAQSHAVHLTSHFVAPWARETGLAKMLLQRAEKQAKSKKYTVVNLDVRETQVAAIKLYENQGYENYATHPAYAYADEHYVAGHYFMKILDAV
jgi:ribosomal protein S18 acetylase RimI-like enzyme